MARMANTAPFFPQSPAPPPDMAIQSIVDFKQFPFLLLASTTPENQRSQCRVNMQTQTQSPPPSANPQTHRNPFIIPQDLKAKANLQKMILVMDLDETMVFTRRKKRPNHNNFIQIQINDNIIYVEFRPLIAEFLLAASQLFTVYVYTAGSQLYADKVLDSIPNSTVIVKRFYRESCIAYKGTLIKDLQLIRRTLEKQGNGKKLVLVDDNVYSIAKNNPHAIKVKAYEGNQEDQILHQIFDKLINYYRQHCESQ